MVFESFRTQIITFYNGAISKADFNDHLLREFNKKVRDLGLSSTLYFTPFDGGLRFIGSDLGVQPSNGFIFVFANSEQVLTNEGDSIEIPEQYAND